SSLERHHHTLLERGGENFIAILCQKRLVGGDHVLAVGDRCHDQLTRDRIAPDELHDNIDFGVRHDLHAVSDNQNVIAHQTAGLVGVSDGNSRHFDTSSGPSGYLFGVLPQHLPGAAADHAQAQQAYLDGTTAHLPTPSL